MDSGERLNVVLIGRFSISVRIEEMYAVYIGFGTKSEGREEFPRDWICTRGERWARDSGTLTARDRIAYRYGYRRDSDTAL